MENKHDEQEDWVEHEIQEMYLMVILRKKDMLDHIEKIKQRKANHNVQLFFRRLEQYGFYKSGWSILFNPELGLFKVVHRVSGRTPDYVQGLVTDVDFEADEIAIHLYAKGVFKVEALK